MCGLLHTWISIFDIAIPYLRPNKATNWNFLVPSGLFVTKAPCSSPFSPAQHNCWREESPNMWNTFLGQVIIFFYGLMRVILKTEVREMIFGHAVITWIFSWFFIIAKSWILGFWKSVSGEKKQKDVKDDGTSVTGNWQVGIWSILSWKHIHDPKMNCNSPLRKCNCRLQLISISELHLKMQNKATLLASKGISCS